MAFLISKKFTRRSDICHINGTGHLQGLHHHAQLPMIVFDYLKHRRLASALQGGNYIQCTGTATAAIIPSDTPRHECRTSSRDLRSLPHGSAEIRRLQRE
jgi:hypothetical protein